jgi:plasmid stability protein
MLCFEGMSKNIQIRAVPEDIHRALRARAAAAGMSLSDYLRVEITRVAERPPIAEVLARAATRSGGAPVDDIVSAVRSGRDRA